MTVFQQGYRRLRAKLFGGRKVFPARRNSSKAQSGAKKIAILFLSHVVNDEIIAEYRKISEAVKDVAQPHFLLNVKRGTRPDPRIEDDVFPFTDGILRTLRSAPLADSFVPGSAHFPLLHFFSKQNHYEHYWLIEYDVRFSGDWKNFFNSFHGVEADFLTCCIRRHSDEPDWLWWESLNHPIFFIPREQRLGSFNPIYRISNPALKYLRDSHRHGWIGHFEILSATLLHHAGFTLADFGGKGIFVPPDGKNKFYTDGHTGTVRDCPIHPKTGELADKLYHPVKTPKTASG